MDFVPHSLRDVPLQKSNVEWADIGGESLPLSVRVILTANFYARAEAGETHFARNIGMAYQICSIVQAVSLTLAFGVS